MKCRLTPVLLAATLLCVLSSPVLGAGWVVAEGGGLSGSAAYMHDLFTFMVQKSGKEKPTVVILGAVPLEKDERVEAFQRAGAGEVNCLVVTQAEADSPATYAAIAKADIIFIRGGDQGRYVGWWRGKMTESAIKAVFDRGGVISGSSAGCAIMGEWTYDALKDGLSPREVLGDARHPNLTLTHGFLGLVPNVLFDTHFTERGRLPRTIVMLARIASTRLNNWKDEDLQGFTGIDELRKADLAPVLANHPPGKEPPSRTPASLSPLAIGVDPRTAVCVGPDGNAIVLGEGTATLLRLSDDSTIVSQAGFPPGVTNVHYSQVLPGTKFSTTTGEIIPPFRPGPAKYSVSIPTPSGLVYNPITIDGGNPDDAMLGFEYVKNAERREAEKAEDTGDKRLDASIADGTNKVPVIITTTAWSKRHPQWSFSIAERALALRPGAMAFFLDEGCQLKFDTLDVVEAVAKEGTKGSSCVILDTRRSKWVGVFDSRPPSVHLEDATVTILAPGQSFSLTEGRNRRE